MLQPPQWFAFVRVSTHALLQLVRPPEHWLTQLFAWQTWPAAHERPHMPQFFGSLVVSVHVPLQLTRLPGQSHMPLVHVSLPAHCVAQFPQWSSSTLRSTQAPLQLVRPVLHMPTQEPAWHSCPLAQVRLQAPQLVGLEVRSTQVSPQRTWVAMGHGMSPSPGTQRCATQAKPLGQEAAPGPQKSSSVREHALSASSARKMDNLKK